MKMLALLALALGPPPAAAHPSCCTKHLMPFIPDPDAVAPALDDAGRPQKVRDPNPENVRPDDWDDDDDGPWEPNEIDNPDFAWAPPLKPNPAYKPPELSDSLALEVQRVL